MRKIILGFVFSVIILLSYQNCEKLNDKPSEQSKNNTNLNAIANLANENIQSIQFTSAENVSVQKNLKTYTVISQNSYSLNYQSGEIIKSIEVDSSQKKYCLSAALLSELHGIIESSSVCKTENKMPAGQVCTMVYISGYAQIVTSTETHDLGSGSDGCSTNKIDFCEASSTDMLKGWFAAVKNQLPQLSCQ